MPADVSAEVTDLLQHLIRNACVNDGTAGSGAEVRNADLLQTYLEGSGADIERFEPEPGRTSLVLRIEGRDEAAPSLMLMGHTDVVPVNPDRWVRDPFGGELVDGEVWGRGATDMLDLTASMAVAVRQFVESGVRPRGTLVYLAVADEEALGTYGAEWLTKHVPDAVAVDYVITEGGGTRYPSPTGPKITASVAEKGTHWCRLRVHGAPSHASRPWRTDNALVKAAEVVRRIAEYRPETRVTDAWKAHVEAMDYDPDLTRRLLDPDLVWETCEELPGLSLARQAHACTHLTLAPTVVHGGQKTNVIPDLVEIDVDIRTLPGQTGDEVEAVLAEILAELADAVEVVQEGCESPATTSPTDTPLWASMQSIAQRLSPGARVVPTLMAGATDARFFRRQGTTAYGFGLMSGRIPLDQLASMFHGDNERIDVESLRLTTELWSGLLADFVV